MRVLAQVSKKARDKVAQKVGLPSSPSTGVLCNRIHTLVENDNKNTDESVHLNDNHQQNNIQQDQQGNSVVSVSLLESIARLERILYIQKLEDWYEIPKTYIATFGGNALAKHYSTVAQLVSSAYPSHPWLPHRFQQRPLFTPQLFLARMLRALFSPSPSPSSSPSSPSSSPSSSTGPTMQFNSRSGHGLMGLHGKALEVDIYFPDLKLGFEYQDPHHYFRTSYGQHTLSSYQKNDMQKKEKALENGLTLIAIPFWWNWDKESLIATILDRKPDLSKFLLHEGELPPPLTEDPPPHIIAKYANEIPGLGTPMLAVHTPLSHSFDPSSWWVMEKFDGVRALWNSEARALYSRWGKPITLPSAICDSLPNLFWLDAEIWFGRQKGSRYQAITVTRNYTVSSVSWKDFKLMVFDSPNEELRNEPYAKRYQFLKENFGSEHMYAQLAPYHLVPHDILKARQFVEDLFFKFRALGGEGIILRNPASTYEHGYSSHYFKHKGFLDAEAMILERKSDTTFIGKVSKDHLFRNYISQTPARPQPIDGDDVEIDEQEKETWELKAKEPPFFEVELPVDAEIFDGDIADIKLGQFVSFRYSGEMSHFGPPKNPKIYAIRTDISNWNQLLHSKSMPPVHRTVWAPPVTKFSSHKKRKEFFDTYAEQKGFDPLIADNWYAVSQGDILSRHGGNAVLNYYNSSPTRALFDLYPSIGLQLHKFVCKPKRYWASQENRRTFFVELANKNSFSPSDADAWHKVTPTAITNIPGGSSLLSFYKNNYPSAICDTFPELNLDSTNFVGVRRWTIGKLKQVFEKFALASGFESHVPSNWHQTDLKKLSDTKEGKSIIRSFGSLIEALILTYPDIGVTREAMSSHREKYQLDKNDVPNHKQVFERLAAAQGFDPSVPDNWYCLTKSDFNSVKDVRAVIACYGNSHATALMTSFPDIGLEKSQFRSVMRWTSKEARRQFFDSFASKKSFDPLQPSNWYSISSFQVRQEKGGSGLLLHYGNSAMTALLDLYPSIGLKREGWPRNVV